MFIYFSTPPAEYLKEILFNVPRVSFYGFLMAMAKSDSINEHIGKKFVNVPCIKGNLSTQYIFLIFFLCRSFNHTMNLNLNFQPSMMFQKYLKNKESNTVFVKGQVKD